VQTTLVSIDMSAAERLAMASAAQSMAAELLDSPVGVGIDVVDVREFERLSVSRYARFYGRCFSQREIVYCSSQAYPAQHFAVRFAAKEAAVKALSAITSLAYWQIEVERRADGRPELALWTLDRTAPLTELGELQLRVSLSHAETWAIALVVASTRDRAHAA
jgi:holo-[acyl-carrier protein] synthase